MKASIASRYILKQLIMPFFTGFFIFLFILLMFQALRLSDFVVIHGVSLLTTVKMISYLSLSLLPVIIPISYLFSVVWLFGRMSTDFEIMAFNLIGIRTHTLVKIPALMGTVVCIVCLLLSFWGVPHGNRQFEVTIDTITGQKVAGIIQEGVFIEGYYGLILFTEKVHSKQNRLENVFVYDDREEELPLSVVSKTAELFNDTENKVLAMKMKQGDIYLESGDPNSYHRITFDEYRVNLYPTTAISMRNPTPPSLSYGKLREKIAHERKTGRNPVKLLMEEQRRYAVSFACIVFALIGLAFGVRQTRKTRSSHAFITSLIVMTIYYVIYMAGISLGSKQYLNPVLAMWLPNIVLLAAALLRIRKLA